jgi:hypothetical protein
MFEDVDPSPPAMRKIKRCLTPSAAGGSRCQPLSQPSLAKTSVAALPLHRGFDGLSERTLFICAPIPLAPCSKSAAVLGGSRRGGNAFGKA